MPQAKTVEWGTPQDLFDRLNEQYKFTLDPCATPENAKCPLYYTKEVDGLSQTWDGHTVFCNPPYGREIADWVRKAVSENALTVMLIPARTDTKWFHDYLYEKENVKITFIKGRLKYGGCDGSAPFPSMLVEIKGKKEK